jgi:hypothetical protein
MLDSLGPFGYNGSGGHIFQGGYRVVTQRKHSVIIGGVATVARGKIPARRCISAHRACDGNRKLFQQRELQRDALTEKI